MATLAQSLPRTSRIAALQSTSGRNLVPSPPSSYCRFSNIRTPTTMNHTSSAQGRYASMDTNAFMPPGGETSPEETCVKCATKCQDTSCTVATITSQCTDQCVVVACNDPAHGEMSCHGAQHCNATCNNGTDCPDCSGFEEFVGCAVSSVDFK
jgi:hypothetical protein